MCMIIIDGLYFCLCFVTYWLKNMIVLFIFLKEKPLVRGAAITLFGDLSRFGSGPSKEQFIEQVHSNLVPLLLHLNDEDRHVIKVLFHIRKFILL